MVLAGNSPEPGMALLYLFPPVSQDILVQPFNDEQMRDLNRLKEWLYRERTQIRLDRECAERRQKRGEEVDRRKAEQPALFEF